MTDQEILEVIQARIAGATIQRRWRLDEDDDSVWADNTPEDFEWDFARYDYRVKPFKPKCLFSKVVSKLAGVAAALPPKRRVISSMSDIIDFGKYKGKRFSEVLYSNCEYIAWAVDSKAIILAYTVLTHQSVIKGLADAAERRSDRAAMRHQYYYEDDWGYPGDGDCW